MYSRFNPFYRNNAEPSNGPGHPELSQPMPYTPGVPGSYISDETQLRSHSTPPTTTNNNLGAGVLNSVNGTQNNNNKTDVWEGDRYTGNILGGNVGGRGNTNTIHNNGGLSPPRAPPLVHATTVLGVSEWDEQAYMIAGMTEVLRKIEEDVEQMMKTAQWSEKDILRKKIQFAERMRVELTAELGHH